jgi:hypothetical protein
MKKTLLGVGLILALLNLTACPAEGDGDGEANNGANNGVNNGENNGTNNGANNGANNGVNNGENNGEGCEPACAEGESCVDGACVADPACQGDADCQGGQVCVEGVCEAIPPECDVDRDCGANELCVEGECIPQLPTDCVPACAEGQTCDNGLCVDGPECVVNEDCAEGEVCVAGVCQEEVEPVCAQDGDCGANERCIDGECIPQLPTDCVPACAEGQTCDNGLCVIDPDCVVNEDCGQGEVCAEGVCILEPPVDCDPACGEGQTCVEGVCVDDPACAVDADCEANERCVEGECLPQLPLDCVPACAQGQRCVNGLCVAEPECAVDGDCEPGEVCVAGACEAAPPECVVDGDCGDGEVCVAGACEVAPPARCEQVGEVCAGPEADNGALRCAALDPGAPSAMTCVAVCGPGRACANATTCDIVSRGEESLALCVPGSCAHPLDLAACEDIGEGGGNCVALSPGVSRCVEAGDQGLGDLCQSTSDCEAGLACFAGACRDLCSTNGEPCARGLFCVEALGVVGYGACVPQNTCTNVGQPCDELTQETPLLACVAGDNTDLDVRTCHARCDSANGDAECPTGSFCNTLGDSESVCLRSNCNSPINPDPDCGALGENGGSCVPFNNGAFYCLNAGAAAEGAACVALEDCAAGLNCLDGRCTSYCLLGNDATCGGNRECIDVLNADSAYGLCADACPGFDATDECGPGRGCFPFDEGQGFCTDAGAVALGGACQDSDECVQFATCSRLLDEDPQTCTALCERTQPDFGDSQCAQGEICLSLGDYLGGCFDGCTPFSAQSGCTERGRGSCIPIDDQDRGVCLESGAVPLGGRCLIEDSVLGDCAPGLACVAGGDPSQGTCEPLCRTFTSVSGAQSGCAQDEVCATFGDEWGVCSDDVDPSRPAPYEDCATPGQWCDNDSLCLQAGEGQNLCVALCRLDLGDGDCPGALVCEALLESETIGLCVAR